MLFFDVFAKINTIRRDVGQHFLKRHDLMLRNVAPVVNQYIDKGNFGLQALPEVTISLVADKDFYPIGFKLFAGRVDVNTINIAFLPKIVAPHPQAAAGSNADFDDMDFLANEFPKMALINIEVMAPLLDAAALLIIKELFKATRFSMNYRCALLKKVI